MLALVATGRPCPSGGMEALCLATSGTKKASWLAKPRKDRTSVGEVGVGKSVMARTFSGSGLTPSEEMTNPAKEMEVPQANFLKEMVIPASLQHAKTTLIRAKSSCSVLAWMSMSSTILRSQRR